MFSSKSSTHLKKSPLSSGWTIKNSHLDQKAHLDHTLAVSTTAYIYLPYTHKVLGLSPIGTTQMVPPLQ